MRNFLSFLIAFWVIRTCGSMVRLFATWMIVPTCNDFSPCCCLTDEDILDAVATWTMGISEYKSSSSTWPYVTKRCQVRRDWIDKYANPHITAADVDASITCIVMSEERNNGFCSSSNANRKRNKNKSSWQLPIFRILVLCGTGTMYPQFHSPNVVLCVLFVGCGVEYIVVACFLLLE